ncbi:MAG: hypothetical protein ACOY71_05115 [Gemmatimonadota bacterium]
MDQLERAVRDGRRVALHRRGTEYVVVAEAIKAHGGREALLGRLPMTGEQLVFVLDDVDAFEVL